MCDIRLLPSDAWTGSRAGPMLGLLPDHHPHHRHQPPTTTSHHYAAQLPSRVGSVAGPTTSVPGSFWRNLASLTGFPSSHYMCPYFGVWAHRSPSTRTATVCGGCWQHMCTCTLLLAGVHNCYILQVWGWNNGAGTVVPDTVLCTKCILPLWFTWPIVSCYNNTAALLLFRRL